jgi:hypothetical protein
VRTTRTSAACSRTTSSCTSGSKEDLAATNQLIGSITEADLKVLTDALEEESSEDQDYYVDQATIDLIGDGRATEHLLKLLRDALGSSEGVEIRWERR